MTSIISETRFQKVYETAIKSNNYQIYRKGPSINDPVYKTTINFKHANGTLYPLVSMEYNDPLVPGTSYATYKAYEHNGVFLPKV